MSIETMLSLAADHRAAGRICKASSIYREILTLVRDPQALYFLGCIEQEIGHAELAGQLLGEAATLDPELPNVHAVLAVALIASGALLEAAAALRLALAQAPERADIRNELGAVLGRLGQIEEAIVEFDAVVRRAPDFAPAQLNLGTAISLQRRWSEAVGPLMRAATLQPSNAEPHFLLGRAHEEQREYARAAAAYEQAISRNPADFRSRYQLGVVLRRLDRADEAVDALHAALRISPDSPEAHYHLGGARLEQGDVKAGLDCFKRAMELRPADPAIHSAYALAVHFDPRFEARAILQVQKDWEARHAQPLKARIAAHLNNRNPERRLRIGYVSPYLRGHVIGQWLLPLLEQHNHAAFEIFAYSDARCPDVATTAIRAECDQWRESAGSSNEAMADCVRADKIDILIDLTMHMGNNRLPVFARKPAPIQVAYLAYPSTTGLAAMDYRLTDPYLDPPSDHDDYYTERSVRLPETWCCYRPVAGQTPEVGPLPALSTGHITFGCLNNACKVTPQALSTWFAVMREVTGSHLLLHGRAGAFRQRVLRHAAAEGVNLERISFVGLLPQEQYFRQYLRIDITLDSFPYAGGTTTCDALWMGVPVVSLVGGWGVSRSGVTLLSGIGLSELLAYDPQAYINLAITLSDDLPRLRQMREGLRDRMRRSPLMDAPRFAYHLEAAYRDMWRRWCSQLTP